ncbi:MAG: deoxyribonuclease IV [Desulfopila sp.]
MPCLGAHESVSGGLHRAFDRIHSVGGTSLQIFSRNQRQWNPPELSRQEIEQFRGEWRNCADMEVASHASYLINLASTKDELWHKSINGFAMELERCRQLGIKKAVLHPGSHGGAGVEEGIGRFVAGLDRAIARARSETMVLIETTAGQGTGLGSTFEEIAAILNQSQYGDRLAVCVDTCHIFAAGYDIRTPQTYAQTMAHFDDVVGIEHIAFFHLNDSKKDLGSRVDRHTHIGEGCIGEEGFRALVNDAGFASYSMALETPKDKDLEDDRRNLRVLTDLMGIRASSS